MDEKDIITITGSTSNDTFVIDLNSTYGTTTTYLGDNMSSSSYVLPTNYNDTIIISDGINSNITLTSDWSSDTVGIDIGSIFGNTYHEQEIEKMCKEYPGLEKVWKNFKSVYDMVKQDYEGKKRAGEIDE